MIVVCNEITTRDGVEMKEVAFKSVDGPAHKHFAFFATDDELEAMADRLLEIAGVEVMDE